MKRFIITGILILIAAAVFGIYYYEGTLPANASDTTKKTFVIGKGDSVNKIINNLDSHGLIRNKLAFYILLKKLQIENSIQAGLFRLSPSMSAEELAVALTRGSDDVWVTIIEGIRKEEAAQILSTELGIPESEFIKKAQEGHVYPDTYLIPRGATIDQILSITAANYDSKFTQELKDQALNNGLTEEEVIIIASLVEREANTPGTMQEVASIILKRLNNDWPLQIDATVQYALGYQEDENSWWKRNLTAADLKIPSLYNTYTNPGLPPAPIASPGIQAIKAVVQADANTPYWYYISNKDGSKMYYARTLEEHNANIARHLR